MTDTALLVIDVQESFRHRPDWAAASHPDIVGAVNRLVDHARAAGDRVVWILHTEPGTGTVFDPAVGHTRLMAGLQPRPEEPVLTKTSINSFTTTNLAQLLTTWGVTTLRTCGIRTEQCVETTTRVAADLGYTVEFVTDATATTPIPHPDVDPTDIDAVLADPRTLTTADLVARTERVLSGRGFAKVTTVAEVTGTEGPVTG